MLLFLLLSACEQAPSRVTLDGKPIDIEGVWMQIESPPGHLDQDCWVWEHLNANATFGGPVCLTMGD